MSHDAPTRSGVGTEVVQQPKSARKITRGLSTVALIGGLAVSIIQVGEWVDDGGPTLFLRIPMVLAAILIVAAVLKGDIPERTGLALAVSCVAVVLLAGPIWYLVHWPLTADSAVGGTPIAGHTSTTATSPTGPRPPTLPSTGHQQPATRTMSQWTDDINAYCRGYLEQVDISQEEIRDARQALTQMADRQQGGEYKGDFAADVEAAYPAIALLSTAYSGVIDGLYSIGLPSSEVNQRLAQGWLDNYHGLVTRTFSILELSFNTYRINVSLGESAAILAAQAIKTGVVTYSTDARETSGKSQGVGISACP